MLLFLSIAIIQGIIVTLGDVFILGIEPASMGLLMVFTIVTAITFTFIIYTLVSIFGNLGKAIAVVIMVFQIAGAGEYIQYKLILKYLVYCSLYGLLLMP